MAHAIDRYIYYTIYYRALMASVCPWKLAKNFLVVTVLRVEGGGEGGRYEGMAGVSHCLSSTLDVTKSEMSVSMRGGLDIAV